MRGPGTAADQRPLVSATSLSAADVHDLSVVAEWLAPTLARGRERRRPSAQIVAHEPVEAMVP